MSDRNWFIDWLEDWSQLFQACNWYTFHFCHIEFEWDKMMGGVEFTFIALGLGFRWRWNYTVTAEKQDLLDRIADIKARTEAGESFEDIIKSKKDKD